MRHPAIFMGLPFALIAIVAGCGGSSTSTPSTTAPSASASASTSPSSSSSPSGSPSSSSSPSTSPLSSSSPAGVTWTFAGSTASQSFAAGTIPPAVNLAAYHSITVKTTFVAPSSGSGTINFSDALNGAQSVVDVTPNTLPADTANAGYTPVIYISIVNTGSSDISFGTAVPTVTLGGASFGSATTCNLDVYGSMGAGLTWFTVPNAGVPSGGAVTVGGGALSAGNTVDFNPGDQQIVAVSCH